MVQSAHQPAIVAKTACMARIALKPEGGNRRRKARENRHARRVTQKILIAYFRCSFSEKIVAPFCAHEGSAPGRSAADIPICKSRNYSGLLFVFKTIQREASSWLLQQLITA
jgi:hypothetical protein